MGKYEEYLICKTRGHVGSGTTYSNATVGALTWNTCKYCGTDFTTRTTSELLEKNQPTEPEGKPNE
jgi:hypothetical protein